MTAIRLVTKKQPFPSSIVMRLNHGTIQSRVSVHVTLTKTPSPSISMRRKVVVMHTTE